MLNNSLGATFIHRKIIKLPPNVRVKKLKLYFGIILILTTDGDIYRGENFLNQNNITFDSVGIWTKINISNVDNFGCIGSYTIKNNPYPKWCTYDRDNTNVPRENVPTKYKDQDWTKSQSHIIPDEIISQCQIEKESGIAVLSNGIVKIYIGKSFKFTKYFYGR